MTKGKLKLSVLLLAGIFAFSCREKQDSEQKSKSTASLQAVPVSSALICEVKNIKLFAEELSKSELYTSVQELDITKKLQRDNAYFSMINNGTEQSERNLTVALSQVGIGDLSLIIIADLKKDTQGSISPKLNEGQSLTQHKYDGKTIYGIKEKDETVFYYFCHKTLVVGSSDKLYLEQSLLQLGDTEEHSLLSDPFFVKYYNMSEAKENAFVFINVKQISELAIAEFGLNKLDIAGSFGHWLIADLAVGQKEGSLSGIISQNDASKTFSKVLAGQKPREISLDNYFPRSTSYYVCYNIHDWQEFFKNYISFLKANAEYHLYNRNTVEYGKIFGGEFYSFFSKDWAGEGFAYINVPEDGSRINESGAVIMGIHDSELAYEAFAKLQDSVYANESYRNIEIGKIDRPFFFRDLFNSNFATRGLNYFAALNDVAIAASSRSVLCEIIDDILDENTLAKLNGYIQAKGKLQSYSNMLTMVRGDVLQKQLAGQIKINRAAGIYTLNGLESLAKDNADALKKFTYNFYQFSDTNSVPFITLLFFTGDGRETSRADKQKLWSYTLETSFGGFMMPFPNHRTGHYDVLVRDSAGMLYLLSASGKLYWKKKFPETISDVKIIDIYNSKKYQLAFSAGGKNHVLDRNGVEVTDPKVIPLKADVRVTEPSIIIPQAGELVFDLTRSGKMNTVIISEQGRMNAY